MDNLLNAAEYMIMLSTNTVSEITRDEYFSNVTQYDSCINGLELILKSVLKGLDNNTLSAEDALKLIENEYNKSTIPNFLEGSSGVIELACKLIDARSHEPGTATIEELKSYVEIADKLDKCISISIYRAVLNRLVIAHMVLEDIDFSKKLMDGIKNNPNVNDNMTFFNIIHDALEHI